jgi:hypothetical protein
MRDVVELVLGVPGMLPTWTDGLLARDQRCSTVQAGRRGSFDTTVTPALSAVVVEAACSPPEHAARASMQLRGEMSAAAFLMTPRLKVCRASGRAARRA